MRSEPTREAARQAETARKAYQRKDYGSAASGFGQAAGLYEGAGDRLSAAEMRNNQGIALLMQKDYAQALAAIRGTEAVFKLAGDSRRQGMALANQAAVLEGQGRKDGAAKLYEQAAACLQAAGEKDLYADVMRSLAGLQARQGRVMTAAASMQTSLGSETDPGWFKKLLKKIVFLRLWR